jgi:hypothetical protein
MSQSMSHGTEDLVHHWEGYRFMAYYEKMNTRTQDDLCDAYNGGVRRLKTVLFCPSRRIFQDSMNDGPLQVSMEALRSLRALLTESLHLVRIIQATWLLYHPRFSACKPLTPPPPSAPTELFIIRILLDLSWDDMRTAICLLRPIIAEKPQKFREMLLVMPTLCSEIYPESFTSLGFLHLKQKFS